MSDGNFPRRDMYDIRCQRERLPVVEARMTANIVTDALTMAWFRKKPAAGLMHHSDRGSQYASKEFQRRFKKYGMICSMNRKGNC